MRNKNFSPSQCGDDSINGLGCFAIDLYDRDMHCIGRSYLVIVLSVWCTGTSITTIIITVFGACISIIISFCYVLIIITITTKEVITTICCSTVSCTSSGTATFTSPSSPTTRICTRYILVFTIL